MYKIKRFSIHFSSVGDGGVSTLVACELLSDVHDLCAERNDGKELIGLRKYLVQDRGWRCLTALHLLGVRGLSCGRELVALLVALYPVALQEGTNPNLSTSEKSASAGLATRNEYIKFHYDDNIVDTVDIIHHAKRKTTKSNCNGFPYEDKEPSRRRSNRKHLVNARFSARHKQRPSILQARCGTLEATSSESELLTGDVDQSRSLTLKIRLNPMDFEYFTSVVRSDDEQKWQTKLYELPPRHVRKTPHDYIDERIQNVLDARINNFEISFLIIQLLQSLRDYDIPAEQTPAVQVLKFALDTLWSLQFGIDENNLSGTECATLKAAAARLMLMAMERVLRAAEPTAAVIHNGLLPMILRLLEDACSKPVNVLKPEEGSLLQEFIFSTIYGIITFLYCLLHQRGSSNADKLADFLELFQLFVESQDGKLVERTMFTIIDLPSLDPVKSITRAKKIIDTLGVLISGLKRIRRNFLHATRCHKTKHKSCIKDNIQSHHHSDILGISYLQSILSVTNKQVCCISSLFMTLTNLLKESHLFVSELQVKLIKVITTAGICCCFPPNILISNIVSFLKKHDPSTYAPAVVLLERTLFKELGAYPVTNACCICDDKPANYSWDFLEMYVDLLSPNDPKLCYIVIAHLLKVTPSSKFHVREQFLLKVFYPTFLRAKACYLTDRNNSTAKFLLQSCMSIISCLIVNVQMCEKFMEMNGLEEILVLLPDGVFTKNIYALLEVTVTTEICRICCEETRNLENNEMPATRALFESLNKETIELLNNLQHLDNQLLEEKVNEFGEKNISNAHADDQKVKLSFIKDLNITTIKTTVENLNDMKIISKLPDVQNVQKIFESYDISQQQLEHKTDEINATVISNSSTKISEKPCTFAKQNVKEHNIADMDTFENYNLYQASAAWRAAAGVALCSPKFRNQLSLHPVSRKSFCLFKLLAIDIATGNIEGNYDILIFDKLLCINNMFVVLDTSKSAHKLFEALITCCLTSQLCEYINYITNIILIELVIDNIICKMFLMNCARFHKDMNESE